MFEFLTGFENFVGVNFWTMLFAWCNLLILYLFLRKILFKPVKNMIDSRQKEIDDMYSEAEASRSDAEKLKAEYEEKIGSADEESERILKDAQRRGLIREEEILKEANEQASRTIERAREEIELEKKRALNEVKNEVSDMALEIAEAVIEKDLSKEDHARMIDEFLDGIGGSDD